MDATTAAGKGGYLARLRSEEVDSLLAAGHKRRFARGATLFNEGETSDRIVLLLDGRVKVSSFTEDGKEVVLGIRDPGDLLGEFSAIDGQPRSATVTALERVEGLVLDIVTFKAWLGRHSHASLALLELVLARLRDADRKRAEFSAYDTVGRVARRLVELAERFGSPSEHGVEIRLPLSQDELAAWTGASRVGVSQALKSMRERGWIDTGRRAITIRDPQALARRAT